MARPIWTGSLTIGLVNLPVALYSATENRTIQFHQIQRGTHDRVRNRRVNERTGKQVEWSDIVKGYDVGDGNYVVLERDELEAVSPGKSRTIDIAGFADVDQIDPIYFQKSYFLAPRGEEYHRNYALLREAIRRSNKVGVATFVMRDKQYLAAVRPTEDVMILDTMFFADEVRDASKEIGNLPDGTSFRQREMDQAMQLVEAMSVEWRPEQYHDTYREKVYELIDAKRSDETYEPPKEPAESTNVVDLMDALKRSVETAREGRRAGDGRQRRTSGKKQSRTRAAAHEDMSQLTKQELYKRASQLGVAGRSQMNRDELAQAVEEAQASHSRRRKKAS